MLLELIKSDQLEARKAKQTTRASLLTTLLGEAQMIGKNKGNRESTDSEVVAVTKSFLKKAREVADIAPSDKIAEEIDILESYLPKQLTESDMKLIAATVILDNGYASPKDMGKIMKHFKETYDGQYDGAVLSKAVKALLQ